MNHLTYSSGQLSELDLIIIPILQMRKLRGKEVKSPRSKAVNPSLSGSRVHSSLLCLMLHILPTPSKNVKKSREQDEMPQPRETRGAILSKKNFRGCLLTIGR